MDGYGATYGDDEVQVSSVKARANNIAKGGAKDGDDAFSHVFNDPDQMAKYEAIVELLLAAGYFRARISGLSHFDKVIGGLTWCISSSQVDVDIDLFFQEGATTGVKMLFFFFFLQQHMEQFLNFFFIFLDKTG